MHYELSDGEWSTIRPMLPNKARGVPRVEDRHVLNGIFWVLRSGAPRCDLPIGFGPYHMLQPLCALARCRRLEPHHGRARRGP